MINEGIVAPKVRTIFPDGSVEVMETALALRKARLLGLDLILIAPTAEPPVAKAMNYAEYQELRRRMAE
jgi:translation initiation factor IF-3